MRTKMVKEFKFKAEKVDTLPESNRVKGSRFDIVLDAVIKANAFPVKLSVPEFEDKASYLANRLNQRIEKRKLAIVAQAINGSVYIAKP